MGRSFDEYHEEQMREDPEYRAAYKAQEQEFRIAQALIDARIQAGMTQKDVAEKMGISQPAVARMESGRNISLRSIERYATATGQTISLSILPASS